MAKGLTLKATKRDKVGTAESRRMRRAKMVPAVIYGHEYKGIPLAVTDFTAAQIIKHTGLINLEIEGETAAIPVVVKEVQHNYLKNTVTHIDMQAVHADEKIKAMVVLHTFGNCPGEHAGGIIDQQLHEVEVECLPQDVPEEIRIDISHLELDMVLHIRDIAAPAGARFTADPEVPVIQVRLPRVATATDEEEGEVEGEEGGETAEGKE